MKKTPLNGTRAQTKKPSAPTPKAITVFRENSNRFPKKTWWQEIADTIGEDEEDLERWGQIVHLWVGKGFNPMNVVGMLEVFEKGWQNGKRPQNPIGSRREYSGWVKLMDKAQAAKEQRG